MPHAHLVRACSWRDHRGTPQCTTCSPCQGLFLVEIIEVHHQCHMLTLSGPVLGGDHRGTPQWLTLSGPVLGGDHRGIPQCHMLTLSGPVLGGDHRGTPQCHMLTPQCHMLTLSGEICSWWRS